MKMDIDLSKPVGLREVSGRYLTALGEKDEKVLVLAADLLGTSRAKDFRKHFPERTFNVGIAEQFMVSFAAGLAHEGFKPYVCSMAPFLSMRSCEQARTDVAYGNVDVRIIGVYAGCASGISGATHSGLEDCAIFCGMPNMTVLEPSDASMTCRMLDATLTHSGPVYLRNGIDPARPIYPENMEYQIGRAIETRAGSDGAFICSGPVVKYALDAADILEKEDGLKIRVVDMHTLKPIDVDAVLSAAETGHVIAAQDHNLIGGLGYTVAAILAERGISIRYKMLGVADKFVPIATPEYLFGQYGFDTAGLARNMRELFV